MLVSKVLSDEYVDKLVEIFKKKNWRVKEEGKNSVFDRFCKRLTELKSDEERDLIIELTNKFLWVQSNMYEEYLLKALKGLFNSSEWILEEGKAICICPLSLPKDFGHLKSSTFMLYLCQSILLRTYPEFQENQVWICENPKLLNQHMDELGTIILIDDFIGSGETALECLEYLKFINKKKYIVSLVAQEDGIKNIIKKGDLVFSAEIRKKAITDEYSKSDVEDKLRKMRMISKHLKAPKNYQLGYANTESLVAMIKTPNNTFPVYWFENKEDSYAPFTRKNNIKVIKE